MKQARRNGNGRALRNLRPLNGQHANRQSAIPESPEQRAQREEWLRRRAAEIEADMRAAHGDEWRRAQ